MDTNTKQIHNFQAGDLFDRHYRLIEHVGSGGFADVWRAKDELVETVVALKIYTRLDKEGISELAKEYRDMRGIKHPNLLTGNHFDASGNIPYLEMDYCDGGSFYGKLGRLGNDELRHVLRDIAGGLAYLHRESIVHQDIKPENILYDTVKDRYLLSDFGISGKSRTRLSHSMTMNQMTYSMTEAYAPPEKFSGNVSDLAPDTKGDIFSLGMTLFELATGVLPFTSPMATGREMLYSQGRLQLDYGQIKDPVLRSVVEGCTRYDKTQRITAEEILATLNGERPASKTKTTGTTNTDTGFRPPTVEVKIGRGGMQPPPPPPPPTPNRKWIYVVLAAVVVTMGVTLTLLTGHSSDEGIGDNTRLVENFETPNTSRAATSTTATSSSVETFTANGVSFNMVRVGVGSTVRTYYIGETEVTQALWQAVMGSNPSNFKGSNRPVEQVSWNDCKEFIRKLNALTGKEFRLPKESEWEYAAKGGNKSHGYTYSGCNSDDALEQYGWYDKNAYDCGSSHPDYGTHAVKQKRPNELGIYDMSGNVWEWCEDLYSSSGSHRVIRGGSWGDDAGRCRVSNRHYFDPSFRDSYLGFRLALSAR